MSKSSIEKFNKKSELKEFLNKLKNEEKDSKRNIVKYNLNFDHNSEFEMGKLRNIQKENVHGKFLTSSETNENLNYRKENPKNLNNIKKELSTLQSTIDNLEKKLCKF